MPTVLSFLRLNQDAVLANHGHYARLMAYSHIWDTSDSELSPVLQMAYKFHWILEKLVGLPEGEIVLFMDGDTLVKDPLALELILGKSDGVVVDGPSYQGEIANAEHMFVIRNNAANRSIFHEIVRSVGRRVAREIDVVSVTEILGRIGRRETSVMVNDTQIHTSWRITGWFQSKIFAVHLGRLIFPNPDFFVGEGELHDPSMQRFLTHRINAYLMGGEPLLTPASYPALSEDAYTAHNPGKRIAFVTLYTHHINAYGRVSEHNVKRYCERNGYTYHVYRGIPKELDAGINGTWVKSWLVKRHLADHDWVIWIDADILFYNQRKKMEPLLADRDLMFAKDLGAWFFNAGVMGFKNTASNRELLEDIWGRITQVDDKSTVYSSMGDQYYTNLVVDEKGFSTSANIYDLLTINSPPHMRTERTLLIHYVGMSEPYRSAQMAYDDARSSQLG